MNANMAHAMEQVDLRAERAGLTIRCADVLLRTHAFVPKDDILGDTYRLLYDTLRTCLTQGDFHGALWTLQQFEDMPIWGHKGERDAP